MRQKKVKKLRRQIKASNPGYTQAEWRALKKANK